MTESLNESAGESVSSSFPSTHWTQIHAANQADLEAAKEALGHLLERYRPALIAYLCEKFHGRAEQAQDWFQSFVEKRVLEHELLRRVSPVQGKLFRSFLLCALHRFVVSEIRRDQARKRKPIGGWVSLESLDDTELESQLPASPATAAYDVAWAKQVVAQAAARMEARCAQEHRPDIWGVFAGRILGPLLDKREPNGYDQLTSQYLIASPAQAHNLLATGKRIFARCLHEVVAEYAVTKKEIEEELQALHRVLAN